MRRVVLAGKLGNLGDGLLDMWGGWADKALGVALLTIVVIQIVRRLSLKAGIGALLALVIAMGIYQSRGTLAGLFSDEINSHSAGVTGVVAPLDGGTA